MKKKSLFCSIFVLCMLALSCSGGVYVSEPVYDVPPPPRVYVHPPIIYVPPPLFIYVPPPPIFYFNIRPGHPGHRHGHGHHGYGHHGHGHHGHGYHGHDHNRR